MTACDVPDHIKFIYIMILKHNRSVTSLLKRDTLSWEVSSKLKGLWEGGAYAIDLENRVRKFIKDYGILQESELRGIYQ